MKKGFLLRSAIVASLGGLLFGFDTAVISGAEQTLQSLFAGTYESLAASMGNLRFLSSPGFWHGCTTASALIGTILGAWLSSKPSDAFGRRKTFSGGLVLFIASCILIALSTSGVQAAITCGPALGGVLYTVGAMTVYGTGGALLR